MSAIIGTWKMSLAGVERGEEMLRRGGKAGDAVTAAVTAVEDDPRVSSVGYGGLPDMEGRVTLDAAFMDGDTLRLGGVIGVSGIANPILAARLLCGKKTSCLLAGEGAERFALSRGLKARDMRTAEAMARYEKALKERKAQPSGHDTVCVIALDDTGSMAVGTSTSGLFMKAPGRVGDTPLAGSGFYCDTRFGGAAATGLGEDIMRGCLSYETVSLMRRGAPPEEACREALRAFAASVKEEGDLAVSLIALSPSGAFGAASTLPLFPFTCGTGRGAHVFGADDKGIRQLTEQEAAGLE